MIGTRSKFLYVLTVLSFVSTTSFGDCDWTTIKKNEDGTYTYSEQLHLCVGALVQDNQVKAQQITDLTSAISMKDLAIQASDKRADLWMGTSSKLEDRVQKMDSLEKKNEWLDFGLGALTMLAAGYVAAKLIHN